MRGRIRILALSVTLSAGLMVPTLAEACVDADCKPAREAKPQQPLRLEKYRHQPVALGKPLRVVKTPNGDYARVKYSHRSKVKAAPMSPQFLPVALSPEAAAALAMQASVRVVDADELNEIDAAADDPPLVPVRVTTTNEPPLRVASAADDRGADDTVSVSPTPVGSAAVNPSSTRTLTTDFGAWLWRHLVSLGEALVTLFATVRNLLG